ncbi:MAG TPA: class II aldolase/adducin family protein [Novosphingobium sp.]|nr:class II aldolase/adducin family protein [Novosphingobium sp.]
MTDINLRARGPIPVQGDMSDEERAMRRDLAAAYRLVALNGWDDMIGTHISARLPTPPGEPEQFLINPYGMLFERVTASSLVKIDVEGNILSDSPYPVNKAGFVVHSAVHMARPEVACVMHLHTNDGVAVSALEEGLLPLNQTAMIVRRRLSFHDYEGVAVELGERERLVEHLGNNDLMLLRNHGTLSTGRTVAEAYSSMYSLEKACTFQVRTLSMGQPWRMPDADVLAKFDKMGHNDPEGIVKSNYANKAVWPALLDRLERVCPDYKD